MQTDRPPIPARSPPPAPAYSFDRSSGAPDDVAKTSASSSAVASRVQSCRATPGDNGTCRTPYRDFGAPSSPTRAARATRSRRLPKSMSAFVNANASEIRSPVCASSSKSSRCRSGTSASTRTPPPRSARASPSPARPRPSGRAGVRPLGSPCYEDREMVKINIPGDKASVIAPANSFCTMPDGQQLRYNERFEEDYERWKKGQSAALVGTHLKHAPFLSKAEVSNLGALNVFTVEQLADLGGRPLQSLGPQGRKWQQQAVAWLQSAAGTRDATAEAARIAALENEIALLA